MGSNENFKYRVMGIEIQIKDNNQPSSAFFILKIYPLIVDIFHIKASYITLNLTLNDVLALELDVITKTKIADLLNKKNISIKEWENDAIGIFSDIERFLHHRVVELKFS